MCQFYTYYLLTSLSWRWPIGWLYPADIFCICNCLLLFILVFIRGDLQFHSYWQISYQIWNNSASNFTTASSKRNGRGTNITRCSILTWPLSQYWDSSKWHSQTTYNADLTADLLANRNMKLLSKGPVLP